MDKSWMDLPDRFGTRYTEGIEDFIALASNHIDVAGRIRCPCRICNNRYYKQINEVKDHLLDNGMDKHYTRWVHHGEEYEELSDDDDDDDVGADEGVVFDGVHDLLQDLGAPTRMDNPVPDMQYGDADNFTTTEAETFTGLNRREGNATLFEKLMNESRQPLYPGCKKFSKLDYLVKLFHVKVINRWSNKSFDMILQLIKAALPEGETLPKSYHEAKTLMRELGLGYIAIHACKYDCALFWGKDNENLRSCPECGEPRKYVSSFRGSRSGTVGPLFDMMEFVWRCILRKQLEKLLAIILGCMSVAILLAEATLLPSGVDLSLFSILINAVGKEEVLVQEDNILREHIRIHGTERWTSVAAQFKDKTSRQCRRRWYTYLNSECKKGCWTEQEDKILCEAQKIYGNSETEIAKVVSGRLNLIERGYDVKTFCGFCR